MSVVRGKTLPYGPGVVDIQIEQGSDFVLSMALTKAAVPWDLTTATFEAYFSDEWSPGGRRYDLQVTVDDPASAGRITITFPKAESLAMALPNPPRKNVDPQIFKLGNWVLNITDDSVTTRLLDGAVYLDRAPYV